MRAVRCVDGRMQFCDSPAPVPGDGRVLVIGGGALGLCAAAARRAEGAIKVVLDPTAS